MRCEGGRVRNKLAMTALLAVCVAFVLVVSGYVPAWACTPPVGGLPHYTVADHVKAAPVVLEGVATSVTMGSPTELQVAMVQVRRYFKGSGPAAVRITGFGANMACLSPVSVGDHLIIYAKGDPNQSLSAYYLSQFDATAPADAGTISQVQAVTGEGQAPSGPRAEVAGTDNTAITVIGGAAVGFVAGVLVGAIAVLLIKRR